MPASCWYCTSVQREALQIDAGAAAASALQIKPARASQRCRRWCWCRHAQAAARCQRGGSDEQAGGAEADGQQRQHQTHHVPGGVWVVVGGFVRVAGAGQIWVLSQRMPLQACPLAITQTHAHTLERGAHLTVSFLDCSIAALSELVSLSIWARRARGVGKGNENTRTRSPGQKRTHLDFQLIGLVAQHLQLVPHAPLLQVEVQALGGGELINLIPAWGVSVCVCWGREGGEGGRAAGRASAGNPRRSCHPPTRSHRISLRIFSRFACSRSVSRVKVATCAWGGGSRACMWTRVRACGRRKAASLPPPPPLSHTHPPTHLQLLALQHL